MSGATLAERSVERSRDPTCLGWVACSKLEADNCRCVEVNEIATKTNEGLVLREYPDLHGSHGGRQPYICYPENASY